MTMGRQNSQPTKFVTRKVHNEMGKKPHKASGNNGNRPHGGLRAHVLSERARPYFKPVSIPPQTASVGNDNRIAILELDLVDVPRAARRAAAQRVDLRNDTGIQLAFSFLSG
jgi:hypothetical protein